MKAANKSTVRGLTTRAKNTLRDQLVRFFESKTDLTGNEQTALSLLQEDTQLSITLSGTTLVLAGADLTGRYNTVTLHLT